MLIFRTCENGLEIDFFFSTVLDTLFVHSGALFALDAMKPIGWYHLVLNYFGSSPGEGIRVYHDGVEVGVGRGTFKYPLNDATTPGEGRIAIGRDSVSGDGINIYRDVISGGVYGSAEVDELKFFNSTLTDAAIASLSLETS